MTTETYSPLSVLIRKHFDFAIPARRVAIEVEGGAFNGGRHIRPEGYLRDMEKYNEAAVSGWCVIRVLPSELLMLKTVRLIIRAIIKNKSCQDL